MMKVKQICELIVVFNSKGKCDLSILNLKENGDARFFKKSYFPRMKRFRSYLSVRVLRSGVKLKSSIIFDKDCVMW